MRGSLNSLSIFFRDPTFSAHPNYDICLASQYKPNVGNIGVNNRT